MVGQWTLEHLQSEVGCGKKASWLGIPEAFMLMTVCIEQYMYIRELLYDSQPDTEIYIAHLEHRISHHWSYNNP